MAEHGMHERLRKALRHRNVLGAGAEARRKHLTHPQEKIRAVLHEYKRGTLHSGSGGVVKSRKQAIAIALSEARKAGAAIPRR